jgi:hypothetical protein
MYAFGTLFAGVTLVSVMVRVSIPGAKVFGDTPVPAGSDLPRAFDQIGFALLLLAGGLSAGLFVAMTSALARRSGALPTWLTTAGYVVAVLQVIDSLFFPFVLFPLWVLIASILLVRQGSSQPVTGGTGA